MRGLCGFIAEVSLLGMAWHPLTQPEHRLAPAAACACSTLLHAAAHALTLGAPLLVAGMFFCPALTRAADADKKDKKDKHERKDKKAKKEKKEKREKKDLEEKKEKKAKEEKKEKKNKEEKKEKSKQEKKDD
ncbi:Protein of unknown function [Gryllus bimaculatus]|nr:Protein of unknown function [Gryllus bimaculatus]